MPCPGITRGGGASGCGGLRVRPHDHGVGDLDDLVDGQAGTLGVLTDLLGARRLVDADRPEAVLVLEYVTADPADVLGHLVVADVGRTRGRLLEIGARAPPVPAQDYVSVHAATLSRTRVTVKGARGANICPIGLLPSTVRDEGEARNGQGTGKGRQ